MDRSTRMQALSLGGLVTLTIVVAVSSGQLYGLRADLSAYMQPQSQEDTVQQFETTATSADGIVAKITTNQQADETLDQVIARHRAAVLAWQQSGG